MKNIFFSAKKKLFVSQYYEYAIPPDLSSPAQSWEKNMEKSGFFSFFFEGSENLENILFLPKNKNPILLVFPLSFVSLGD